MVGCRSVVSLPESFCRLSNLKNLNLGSFNSFFSIKLESLPERFGQLRALKNLNLCYCESLRELPAGIPAGTPLYCPCFLGMNYT